MHGANPEGGACDKKESGVRTLTWGVEDRSLSTAGLPEPRAAFP